MTLLLVNTYVGIDDPDAQVYIAAVEAADEIASPGVGALEIATKVAIHSFVKGCKNDGIWPAIKASCILASARTLSGALVPLKGIAPTNFNFVAGDYNRKTGLVGNGSNKRLDSNRSTIAQPASDFHLSVFQSTAQTTGSLIQDVSGGISGSTYLLNGSTEFTIRGVFGNTNSPVTASGLVGASVSGPSFTHRSNQSNKTFSGAATAATGNLGIFSRQDAQAFSNARLAFYSIGESLNLELLDTRVTTLVNAFAAAIP